ncbi:hypothetical protein CU044_4058 [Streptomyces sp. L-9-10]|nr:hypothetical protein CU044_4058 [Streptomyces sp. L-9-10]
MAHLSPFRPTSVAYATPARQGRDSGRARAGGKFRATPR